MKAAQVCLPAVVLLVVVATSLQGQVLTPQRVRVPWNIEEKLLTKRTNPTYPKELERNSVQGLVVVRLLITKEGDVRDAKALSGSQELAPFAVAAVKEWKFKPFLLNGEPCEVETTIKINFTPAGG